MAVIFCFSSTGNSISTANRIANEIGGTVAPMTDMVSTCADDVIGFVFPNYFWGLPRIVKRFVSQLQIKRKDAYVFAVVTCGGPAFGVPGMLKKVLLKNGIRLNYSESLIYVTNYIPEYKVNDSPEHLRKVNMNLERVIGEISNRRCVNTSSFTFLNELFFKLMPGQDCDKFFSVSSNCTGCGTCQKLCPAENIKIEAGKPKFLHKCEHCLGCLHNCPAAAINWKNKTQNKKRYRNANVTLSELIAFNARP